MASIGKKLIFILFCFIGVNSYSDTTNQLQAINFQLLPNKQVQIKLTVAKPMLVPLKSFTLENPPRLVLDLEGVQSTLNSAPESVNADVVNGYTVISTENRTRVVFNLRNKVPYQAVLDNNNVLITLDAGAAPPTMNQQLTAAQDKHHITGIDFRQGKNGSGEVVIGATDPNLDVDVETQNGKLIINFNNTVLPSNLASHVDLKDKGTPVLAVDATAHGNDAQVTIATSGDNEHLTYQVNNQFIVAVKPSAKKMNAASEEKKLSRVSKNISLNFQDIQVRAVLQLIAEFTGLNIVTSDSVKGSMTLRLNNVPWEQALDIILKTRGLDKRQIDNVMLIAPADEIAAREKQELQNQQQVGELAPIHAELIQINYATAETLALLLKDKDNSLLSARGTLSVDERTNTLWIQDTEDKLKEIRKLVKRLDIPVRQVLIEARIVTVDKKYEEDLGIRFGITKEHHLTGTLSGANSLAQGKSAADLDPAHRLNVDLPVSNTGTAGGPGSIGLALAKLGGGVLLDLELSALESENQAEVLSNPRLVTANQHEAVIEKGEEIPYQEATSSGATSVAFKKAVLSLRVTPHITPDKKIILSLKVNQDTRGAEVLGTPAINTRDLETQVLVDNGETIVLGGIYERDKENNVTRIPFLGSLPIIGALFRNTNKVDNRTELLIFVTPKIITQSAGIPAEHNAMGDS